ncbi:MAG: hypothetical protein ABIN08_16610 [Caldimonas sp.]
MASEFLKSAAKTNGSASAADEPLIRLGHLPKVQLAVRPPAKSLRLLVVNSRTLHALAASLLESPSNAVSATSDKAETFCAKGLAFDIILLAVTGSTLGAMALAAHLRAIERQKSHPQRAAIIACTVRSAQYLDCLVAGSGLTGALNLPWSQSAVHACLDRWRDGKRLPALFTARRETIDDAHACEPGRSASTSFQKKAIPLKFA